MYPYVKSAWKSPPKVVLEDGLLPYSKLDWTAQDGSKIVIFSYSVRSDNNLDFRTNRFYESGLQDPGLGFSQVVHLMRLSTEGQISQIEELRKWGGTEQWQIRSVFPGVINSPEESPLLFRRTYHPPRDVVHNLFGEFLFGNYGGGLERIVFPKASDSNAKEWLRQLPNGREAVFWREKHYFSRGQVEDGKLHGKIRMDGGTVTVEGKMNNGMPSGEWIASYGRHLRWRMTGVTTNPETGEISAEKFAYQDADDVFQREYFLGEIKDGKFSGRRYWYNQGFSTTGALVARKYGRMLTGENPASEMTIFENGQVKSVTPVEEEDGRREISDPVWKYLFETTKR